MKKNNNIKRNTILLIVLMILIIIGIIYTLLKDICNCEILYFLKEVIKPFKYIVSILFPIIYYFISKDKYTIRIVKTIVLIIIIYISISFLQMIIENNYNNKCIKKNLRWDKPILYLYPTKDIDVSVKLDKPNLLITTYPKYNNGWNIHVLKNGSIYDKDNKYYYALYWDENNINKVDFSTGFYVTKDNAINFLEEKLTYIGLNDRERNEFIMYWLPKLEDNKQSLVYFELTNERELNNKLIINPKPDSLLRVNMHIKKVNKKIIIKEQKLTKFNRYGFTAVEWGGVIHK